VNYRWAIAPPQSSLACSLAADFQISPLLAQCLVNRGVEMPDRVAAFLEPRLKNLADPFLLPNMDAAVARLVQARQAGESLVIFGDYDVDGVTSTAILLEFLSALGWKVDFYLPHRMEEGYGLSQEAVRNCLAKFPVSLLLAVDCGSSANETIAQLKASGIDVIVLDHHQLSTPAPPAHALVNPHLANDATLPFRELCSAGLAFKMAHALLKRGRREAWPKAESYDLRPLLDLVALGTIADLVPLIGENRILVAAGLERLNRTARPGLIALRAVAQIARMIGVYEVGYQLAPRLNAAGRLENAEHALQLLLAKAPAEAQALAAELDGHNRERQRIERGIAEQVIEALRQTWENDRYVIVEGDLMWHVGVVGIVASRVLREFHRPTIIMGGDGESWRGSGRSIEGFDLAAALKDCTDLLLRHGGHAMAAGLSMKPENLAALRTRLDELARTRLTPEQLKPVLRLDAAVPLQQLTLDQIKELARLEPSGQGNWPVHVAISKVRCARTPQRFGKGHLRFWITDGNCTLEAIRWNGSELSLPEGVFDVAAIPQLNEFRGSQSIQLKVLDWRAASTA